MAFDLRELECLTVGEVAEILHASEKTVYRLVAKGELKSVRVGRALRVLRADLITFMRGGEMK